MIVFKTKYHPNVVMFDKVALKLINSMGHSEVVPGALTEDEIATAINTLKKAISTTAAQSGDEWGDSWNDDSVSLSHRGKPLLDLLENAKENHQHVIWEETLR